MANDNKTDKDFRWRLHGTKQINYNSDKQKYPKQYFICAEKKRKRCSAKKTIFQVPGSPQVVYENYHNHYPPPVPYVLEDVKREAMTMLDGGGKVAKIHKQLVLKAPDDADRKNIPSIQQLHNWKHQLNTKHLPTGTYCIQ